VEDALPWPEGMVELTKSGDLEGDKIRRLPVGGFETSYAVGSGRESLIGFGKGT